MIKKITLLLVLLSYSGFSQVTISEGNYSTFSSRNLVKFNKYLSIPTFSLLHKENMAIGLSVKQSYKQFEDSPKLFTLNFSGAFDDRTGIGFYVYQQQIGVFKDLGFVGNFASKIKASKYADLAFGANIAYSRRSVGSNVISALEDKAFQNYEAVSIFMVQPAITYSTKNIDIGLHFENLIDYNMKEGGMVSSFSDKVIAGHFGYNYLLGGERGYRSDKLNDAVIRTLAIVKKQPSGFGFGVNAMVDLPEIGWFKLGYDNTFGIEAGIGANMKQFSISFDYGRTVLGNTMEVGLSYNLKKFKKKRPVVYPPKRKDRKPGRKKPTTKPARTTKPAATTTKPAGTTTKPAGTTTKPAGTTTKPAGTTTKPARTTTKPARTTTKPAGTTTKPAGTTTKPAGTTTKPARPTTKPAGTTTKPAGTTTKPARTPTKPAGTTTKPAGTTTKPAGTTTKPTGTTNRPGVEKKDTSLKRSTDKPWAERYVVVRDASKGGGGGTMYYVCLYQFKDIKKVRRKMKIYRKRFKKNPDIKVRYVFNPKNKKFYIYMDRFTNGTKATEKVAKINARRSVGLNGAGGADDPSIKFKPKTFDDPVFREKITFNKGTTTTYKKPKLNKRPGVLKIKASGVKPGYYIRVSVESSKARTDKFVDELNSDNFKAGYFKYKDKRHIYIYKTNSKKKVMKMYNNHMNGKYYDKKKIVKVE